ncbi:MAG: exonuclease SbcCD subunit D [Clostridiales bacterium]|nr:exonuclease SbcCD subunit D [Clostridiales bacterium]
MKLIHLSDLHIGKRVNDFSMLEDQEYILKKIINIIDDEQPDGVIIAGDIYDKSVPSAEAVQLFDDFLVRLAERGLHVYVISGNHDAPERIAFGSRLMNQSGVYMSPVYNGEIEPISLRDEYGTVNIVMIPFIKPAHVRRFFPDAEIESYTDALRMVLEQIQLDTADRNVLVTHQFVTGSSRSESEEISVGGTDNVDAAIFEPFDYVALGHIHGPQYIGKETVRYCGTPLKYSFSEAQHKKSVTVVELYEKSRIVIREVRLVPKRDMRAIKGRYMDITARCFYEGANINDYLHITLTDEEDIPDAIGKLRSIYPNIMKLDYDNTRTRSMTDISGAENIETKTPIELFGEFYEKQNNQRLTELQKLFTSQLVERIWEDMK